MGFRTKLVVSYAAVIFLTLLLAIGLFSLVVKQTQDDARKRVETSYLQRIQELGNVFILGSNVRSVVNVYSTALGARVLLVDETKLVQVDTATSSQNLENKRLPNYTLVMPRQSNQTPTAGQITLNGVLYRYFARAWETPNAPVAQSLQISYINDAQVGPTNYYNLVVVVPESTLEFNWGGFLTGVAIAALFALALAVGIGYIIARTVTRPLIKMTRASEAIATGDFSQQLETNPKSRDEIGRLAVSFNRMSREVARNQQSMRDFVANVSHELKTPLTSIQGFSQAILDGTADDKASRDHSLTVIHDEAARMRRLVDELLDLSRIESGQLEMLQREVDIERLLSRIALKLGPMAMQRQVTLAPALHEYRQQLQQLSLAGRNGNQGREANPTLPMIAAEAVGPLVWGDPDRLVQIFTNILDNAIKYSPPGGTVRLTLCLSSGNPIQGQNVPGRYYWTEVAVTNSGPLIPADQLPRIFERFYKLDKSRARKKGESTGLGLAITRQLVEAHNGTISVSSTPLPADAYPFPLAGQEALTTFTVKLPLLALPVTGVR